MNGSLYGISGLSAPWFSLRVSQPAVVWVWPASGISSRVWLLFPDHHENAHDRHWRPAGGVCILPLTLDRDPEQVCKRPGASGYPPARWGCSCLPAGPGVSRSVGKICSGQKPVSGALFLLLTRACGGRGPTLATQSHSSGTSPQREQASSSPRPLPVPGPQLPSEGGPASETGSPCRQVRVVLRAGWGMGGSCGLF